MNNKCAGCRMSVIICSIDEARYRECEANLRLTAGVDLEFIRIDNSVRKWSIAKAYNYGARQATADYLLFVHEDVLFERSGWAAPIISKLAEPQCGVIGFVGSAMRVNCFSPWVQSPDAIRGRINYIAGDNRVNLYQEPWKEGQKTPTSDFAPVVVVDGMAMAVSRAVWQQHPFDEKWLTGFHCYDIDFCLQVALNRNNYVYLRAELTHFSNGNYDEKWARMTLRMMENRWNRILPMQVSDTIYDIKKIAARVEYDTIYKLLRKGISKDLATNLVKRYLMAVPGAKNSYKLVILWQYLHKYFF